MRTTSNKYIMQGQIFLYIWLSWNFNSSPETQIPEIVGIDRRGVVVWIGPHGWVGHFQVSFYQCCNQPFLEPITCALVYWDQTQRMDMLVPWNNLFVWKKLFFDSSVHVHCVFQIFIWNLLNIICVIIRE